VASQASQSTSMMVNFLIATIWCLHIFRNNFNKTFSRNVFSHPFQTHSVDGCFFTLRDKTRFNYVVLKLAIKQRLTCEGNLILCAGLLASSQCVSGRSCDRSSRHRFSWFSPVFKQILRWFPISKLLLHATHAALPI
jgi:hypothetical protein